DRRSAAFLLSSRRRHTISKRDWISDVWSSDLCGGSNGNNANEGNNNAGNEKSSDDFSVAMVTDTGGVDDKSFNQSAWEGLQAWGEEHGLEEGSDGYDYAQSEDD